MLDTGKARSGPGIDRMLPAAMVAICCIKKMYKVIGYACRLCEAEVCFGPLFRSGLTNNPVYPVNPV